MTTILALDTSTDNCSVAVSISGEITGRSEIAPRRQAELILPMIDELLLGLKLSISSVDAIAFGQGPGSFMGVRLATGVAQGLGFSINVPLVPVSSLQALAQRGFDAQGRQAIIAAWDARMEEIYWGAYELKAGIMQPVLPDQLSSPEQITGLPNKPWVLVGNAWSIYQSRLSPQLQLESHLLYPSAEAMLPLAMYYLEKGKAVMPEHAHPNYLREQVAFKKS